MKTCILLVLFFFACSCSSTCRCYPYRGVETKPKNEKETPYDKRYPIKDQGYR